MRVLVKTVCTATVEEEWVLDVPDDTDPEEAFDLYSGDSTRLVSVENVEVYDEKDREVTNVEVMA